MTITKKFFLGLTSILFLISFFLFTPNAFAAFSGAGSGTVGDPFQITTADELQEMNDYLGSGNGGVYWKLMNDIDLDVAPYNTGSGWLPIGGTSNQFYGNFDGDGFIISNLFVDRPVTNEVGLFGHARSANIQNVGVVDVNVVGNDHAAGLVGRLEGTGSVSRSYVTGAVTGNTGAGGVVGWSGSSSASVSESYSDTTVIGDSRSGGVVGYSYASISDSYNLGDVTVTNDIVGGVTGVNSTGVSRSYSIGTVSGVSRFGGTIGWNFSSVTAVYWDTEASGNLTDDGGTAKTTAEMKNQATFPTWDFGSVWSIDGVNNNGYPYLQWQDFSDTVDPTINTVEPADNDTGVSISTNLVINFNESVNVGTGSIFIYQAADDSLVEEIDVTSGQVTGGGTSNITIDPLFHLDLETEYYVQIDANAFDDASGNSFAGISDATTWSFTTTEGSVVTGRVSYTPNNPTLEDESDTQVISFTLDEPIVGDTQIVINLDSGHPDLELSSSTVTFLAAEWADTKDITLSMDPGFTFTENINTTITFSVTTSSAYYSGYSGVIPVLVGSAGIDAPIPIQSLSESAISPTVDTMSFALESQPIDDVVITPISVEGQVSFNPKSLIFTPSNWEDSQSITSTPIDDSEYEGTHSDTITFMVTSNDSNYNAFSMADVLVTILDDEPEPSSSRTGGSTAVSRQKAREVFKAYYSEKEELDNKKEEYTKTEDKNVGNDAVTEQEAVNKINGSSDISEVTIDTIALRTVIVNGGLLRSGNKGDAVTVLQQLLNQFGTEPRLVVDGDFGPRTHASVEKYQQVNGLLIDGIVGMQTLSTLTE